MDQPTRILLIEKEAEDARRVISCLTARKDRRADVRWVERLSDAFQQLIREPFDIVILDLCLPDSSGLETCGRLMDAWPDLPVIVYTSIEDESVALAAMHQGVEDYLIKDETGERLLLRAVHYAIERHRMRLELQCQSLTDDLTGLYNRRGFTTFASHHLRAAHRSTRCFCLLEADLDGLKQINDTHGHPAGDQAIRGIAEVLRQTFRSTDLIARVGGDEFLVLACEMTGEAVDVLRGRLDRNLEEFNAKAGLPFNVSMSYGVVVVPAKGSPSLEELMAHADRAMYEHKTTKRYRKGDPASSAPGPPPAPGSP